MIQRVAVPATHVQVSGDGRAVLISNLCRIYSDTLSDSGYGAVSPRAGDD